MKWADAKKREWLILIYSDDQCLKSKNACDTHSKISFTPTPTPEVWEVPDPPRCGRWGRVGVHVSNINLVDTMWMGGVAAFRVDRTVSVRTVLFWTLNKIFIVSFPHPVHLQGRPTWDSWVAYPPKPLSLIILCLDLNHITSSYAPDYLVTRRFYQYRTKQEYHRPRNEST